MKKIKQKNSLWILICVISFFMSSCSNLKEASMAKNKTMDTSTGDGKYIISAQIVYKNFVQKNGKDTEEEIYIRRSIQDYYVKFCESKVTRQDLEKHLANIDGDFKVASLEIEFLEGSLDICDENITQQSRTGKYVIIHRIIEDKKK